MKPLLAALLFFLPACAHASKVHAACTPAGYDRAALDALKAHEFEIANDGARNAFALALTSCLADPDPALRDGIAFEALSHYLRARQLSGDTMHALAGDLEARLRSNDPNGFEQPFAALVLSEIVRADRIEAYFGSSERARLFDASLAYFTTVRDYRGFDAHEGWRHGVAHGSDLLLQWALNPALGKPELARIRDAIATQITPSEHFYIYGEPERLARPILAIGHRGVFSEGEWSAWFAQISAPAPFASWREVFASQAGLAKRHNTTAFIESVYLNAKLGSDLAQAAMLPGSEAALLALP